MTPTSFIPVLAFLVRKPEFGDALLFSAVGMGVVLIVLTGMMLIMNLTGFYFGGQARRADAARAAKAEQERQVVAAAAAIAHATAPAGAALAEGDPRLVAVIAAAAHLAVGQSARIVSIKPAPGDWSAEGRRQIFASHRVR